MSIRATVLLIDDDASIRRLCDKLLRRKGLEVIQTDSGESARNEFRHHNHRISLAFVDLHLPDCSGEDLASEFHTQRADLPIVFFSGNLPPEGELNKDGSPFFYLKKPFTRDTLNDVLIKTGIIPSPE